VQGIPDGTTQYANDNALQLAKVKKNSNLLTTDSLSLSVLFDPTANFSRTILS
jgi:hypothetical protein